MTGRLDLAGRKYPYRMNPWYIGFFLVTTGFLCAGTWFGWEQQGFASDGNARFWATLMFAVPLTIVLRLPSRRHIAIDDKTLTIPRLFNPFLDASVVELHLVSEVYTEYETRWLGLEALTIVAGGRRYRIYPAFLGDKGAMDKDLVASKLAVFLSDVAADNTGRA